MILDSLSSIDSLIISSVRCFSWLPCCWHVSKYTWRCISWTNFSFISFVTCMSSTFRATQPSYKIRSVLFEVCWNVFAYSKQSTKLTITHTLILLTKVFISFIRTSPTSTTIELSFFSNFLDVSTTLTRTWLSQVRFFVPYHQFQLMISFFKSNLNQCRKDRKQLMNGAWTRSWIFLHLQ